MNELRGRLREAAEAHQPDRERILTRMERRMAGPALPARGDRPRPGRRWIHASWPKVVLATLATVGVLGSGGLAVTAMVRDREPPQAAAASDASVTPPPSGPASVPAPSGAKLPATTPRMAASPQASNRAEDGPLRADGTIDPYSTIYWAQSDVTVRTEQPLTSLTVELRIAQTGGVRSTGSWQTLPAGDFTATVAETDGFLVYRWTLKPGRTVPVGQQVFAGQYNHATGNRDARKDTYRADARMTGRPASVWGTFP